MEVEDVSGGEEVEREARRIAVAFGADRWCVDESVPPSIASTAHFCGYIHEERFVWSLHRADAHIDSVQVGWWREDEEASDVIYEGPNEWECHLNPKHCGFFARGMYRLGIEDESLLAQLNHPLSAHEKLELRLSLPREFWPKAWRDEGEKNGAR